MQRVGFLSKNIQFSYFIKKLSVMIVNEKTKRNYWMLILLLLALPLAVWSCRGGTQTEEQQTETTEEPAAEQPAEQPADGGSEHPSEHPSDGDGEHPSEHPDND